MIEVEIEDIAKRIYPTIKNNNCYAWIGSGLSCPNYPMLDELIIRLCKECSVDISGEMDEKPLDYFLKVADDCKSANPEKYKIVLAEQYGKPVVGERRAHRLLMDLPFKGYITTNFDPILSTFASEVSRNLFCYPHLPIQDIISAEKPICYIHGLARIGEIPTGENLILSESEFEEAYNGEVQSFVYQIIKNNSIIFLGCQLQEPIFKRIFDEIKRNIDRIRMQNPLIQYFPKFIILPKFESKQIQFNKPPNDKKMDIIKKYLEWGIELLEYTSSDIKTRPEIEFILGKVSEFEGLNTVTMPSLGSLGSLTK